MTIGYRIIVDGAHTGFDRETVLAVLARLFGKQPDELRPHFDAPLVVKVCASIEAATRVERVLNLAGCRCTVESIEIPPRDTRAAHAGAIEILVDTLRGALARFGPRCDRVLRHLMEAPRYRQLAYLGGALVTLSVLSIAMPGHSALRSGASANAFGDALLVTPAAPAAPDFLRHDQGAITLQREAADLFAAPMRTAHTPFGVVTVERAAASDEQLWRVRWNGRTVRELRAETPPSLIAIGDGRAQRGAATIIGGEAVVVVDSGERTALCPASRTFLVVLPRAGIARTKDLPNNCAELESVTHRGNRILFRFYDQPKSALAFESGRLVKLTN